MKSWNSFSWVSLYTPFWQDYLSKAWDCFQSSMTTRSQVTKLIALIPKDNLRPHAQFDTTLAARIDEFSSADVKALESITSNRHRDAVRIHFTKYLVTNVWRMSWARRLCDQPSIRTITYAWLRLCEAIRNRKVLSISSRNTSDGNSTLHSSIEYYYNTDCQGGRSAI